MVKLTGQLLLNFMLYRGMNVEKQGKDGVEFVEVTSENQYHVYYLKLNAGNPADKFIDCMKENIP